MNNLKVTVGMCLKNVETTIGQAIESVTVQNYRHDRMELIVVDGSSRDETLSIVKDYLDHTDIQRRIFHENKGLGLARQIVVNEARGEYIVWVDGDMVLSTDFVRKQVEFMEQNPQVGIAKGMYELAPGPNLLATLEIYSRAGAKIVDYSRAEASSKSLGTSGCIYRIEAIRQVGGFDEEIRGYGEDWDAELRIRKKGWRLALIPVPYRDYERLGLSWNELWCRYLQRGRDLHDVFQKHKGVVTLYRMLPPAAFSLGLINSLTLYKFLKKKVVFLLPLQHVLKNMAWWIGFLKEV